MTRPYKSKSARICKIFRDLLQRLPSTYPRPVLVIHSSEEALNEYYTSENDEVDLGDGFPLAFCDGSEIAIHVNIQLNKETKEEILRLYLHEMGHLYVSQKYGEKDKRWAVYKEAERFANRFASRWISRLKKEGWL